MSFIFDKLDPPQINVSKYALNQFLNSIPDQKTVSEVLKTWYFPHSAFCSAGQWGGEEGFKGTIAYRLPPGYAF